jgi:UPF0176 protein
MKTLNIAGYKFIPLQELPLLQANFLAAAQALALKGTILLSPEGINLNLAGAFADIAVFKNSLQEDDLFADMTFRESESATQPFKFMRVKIRKEIITMRRPEVRPEMQRAPGIPPQIFKQWLDEKRDITVLDTRNDYEVRFGTFENAKHFGLADFNDFPQAANRLDTTKPVVMFCTGGIRCEKAALHLQNAGCRDVYQLEGGILNYFSKVGGAHYQGECFVFDQRVSVDATLNETGTVQCQQCFGPIAKALQSCPACHPEVA